MKRTIYFVVVAFAVMMASCSKEIAESTVEVQKQATELKSLNNELVILNQSYARQSSGTRMAWWKRVLVTAAADAGAYLISGSISDAVNASRLVWDVTKKDKQVSVTTQSDDSESLQDKYFKEQVLKDTADINTLGDVHNYLCIKLSMQEKDTVKYLTGQELRNFLIKHNKIKNDTLLGSLNKDKSSPAIINKMVDNFKINGSIRDNMNVLKDITRDPERDGLFDVCGTIVEGLENVTDEDKLYIQQVNKTIRSSSISDELKQLLLNCASIANSSAKLWNTKSLGYE